MSALAIIVPLCDMISTFPPLLLSYALIRLLVLAFSHLWVLEQRAVASGGQFSGERESERKIERGSREKGNERTRGRQRANGEIECKLQGLLNLRSG